MEELEERTLKDMNILKAYTFIKGINNIVILKITFYDTKKGDLNDNKTLTFSSY